MLNFKTTMTSIVDTFFASDVIRQFPIEMQNCYACKQPITTKKSLFCECKQTGWCMQNCREKTIDQHALECESVIARIRKTNYEKILPKHAQAVEGLSNALFNNGQVEIYRKQLEETLVEELQSEISRFSSAQAGQHWRNMGIAIFKIISATQDNSMTTTGITMYNLASDQLTAIFFNRLSLVSRQKTGATLSELFKGYGLAIQNLAQKQKQFKSDGMTESEVVLAKYELTIAATNLGRYLDTGSLRGPQKKE